MTDDRMSILPRSAAAAATTFGVLSFIASMTVHPPFPEQSSSAILHWYGTHRVVTEAAEAAMALAVIAFVWFLAGVRRAASSDLAADGLYAFGVCGAALFVAGTWPTLVLAVSSGRGTADAPTGAVVHVLSDIVWFHYASQDLVFAAASACLGATILRGGLGRRWAGWVAWTSAGCALIGGTANFFPLASGKLNGPSVLGFAGFILLDVTMVAVGITSWRDHRAVDVSRTGVPAVR